jgi:hypothetical protein
MAAPSQRQCQHPIPFSCDFLSQPDQASTKTKTFLNFKTVSQGLSIRRAISQRDHK